ncbi:MAG: TlpA family protein disulfide reductase [Thermoanaerobaculaceae bacterium]|nr:TlpA family protein disulfide reductase [Thermoanaerobaculaceae bacterium]
MDRLPALTVASLLLLVLLSCGGEPAPPPSRFEAVPATTRLDPAHWCDVWRGTDGPRLVLPAVVPAPGAAQLPSLALDRWVWLNVWATWCAPCRREMPLLEQWVTRLVEEGVRVDLVYLSVDVDSEALARFVAATPALARRAGYRLRRPDDLAGWLGSLGCAADTAIPVQVIAAPGGTVRCVRTGSLREGDFPLVRATFGLSQ